MYSENLFQVGAPLAPIPLNRPQRRNPPRPTPPREPGHPPQPARLRASRPGIVITRAVPRADLDRAVDELAARLAAKSPIVMRLGLQAFYATQDMELAPALRHLQQQLFAVLATDDAREGLTAFLEKRPPAWKGR